MNNQSKAEPEKDVDPRKMVCFPMGKAIAIKRVVMWAKALTLDPNNQVIRTDLIRALYDLSDFTLED